MAERLKTVVVGLGIGQTHVRAYKNLPEQFEVVAVCDIDEEKAQDVAAKHEIPRAIYALETVCRMDDVDVVDICTPSSLHSRQVLQVLEAGKHAICEKPIAGSLAAVDALLEAEKHSGKRVMPIFNYRFGHGLQKLRLLQERGLTGRVYLSAIEVMWRRRPDYYGVPWRGKWATEMGGTLVTHAIHFLDALLYVVGPAKRVFARTTTRVNPIETEDCAVVSLEMADGSLATVAVTLGSPEEITRQRYCFENLVAESNREPYPENTSDPWTFYGDTAAVDAEIETVLADFEPLPESFKGQFWRFHRALRQDMEIPVTLNNARRVNELLTAIYHSVETGANVTLPIPPDHPMYDSWAPI